MEMEKEQFCRKTESPAFYFKDNIRVKRKMSTFFAEEAVFYFAAAVVSSAV